jgi:3-hydroxymyristoyl/3-hydroxydecanoyl-(acyl carrier protein) dehydratase
MTAQLGFTGVPFDALELTVTPELTVTGAQTPATVTDAPDTLAGDTPVRNNPATAQAPGPVRAPQQAQPGRDAGSVPSVARELRLSLFGAHSQSLRAAAALQRKALRDATRPGRGVAAIKSGITESADSPSTPVPVYEAATSETQFKPLARTSVSDLDATALARLAAGDVAGVFGPAYDQEGHNSSVLLDGILLIAVRGLSPRGGAWGRGRLTASTVPVEAASAASTIAAAVSQAAQVAALSFGLQLCLADATFTAQCPGLPPVPPRVRVGPVSGPVDLLLDVTSVDLVPRPHLTVDARVLAGGKTVGFVSDVTVALVEKPGVPVGPERGGLPSRWLGRLGASGERAILSEFHMAQCCRGDQGIGLGPEFAQYTGRKATRPPDGGLLLVDRVMEINGQRGVLNGGTHRTEYDSPADSWYYQDTANASMPNCVYLETSLQAALMLGYYLGGTLEMPPQEPVTLRNLGGTATVLREVDLRDKTIVQESALLYTSLVPGSSLQGFSYTQSVDGAPYYRGETLFGYFSDAAMAGQTGLDAGRYVPNWLDAQQARPRTRVIDTAARRGDPSARLAARRHLALLDEIEVVDGGGAFGQGYLRSVRAINPADWYFARHFRYDPVIPGSLGVEAVLQAMQEWVLDTGSGDHLRDPAFILPVGAEFTWKYRGQFLPTDGEVTLEVHIKSVRRKPGRVRVTGDASLWKPGLRVYELTDVAVELREEGAPSW